MDKARVHPIVEIFQVDLPVARIDGAETGPRDDDAAAGRKIDQMIENLARAAQKVLQTGTCGGQSGEHEPPITGNSRQRRQSICRIATIERRALVAALQWNV